MRWTGSVPRKALGAGFCRVHSAPIHMGSAIVPGGEVPMKAISRLLLACAAVTIAASQADAGEFVVTGAGRIPLSQCPAARLRPWALAISPRLGAPLLRAAVPQRSRGRDCGRAGRCRAAVDPACDRGSRRPPAAASGRAAGPASCGSAAGAKCGSAAGTGYASAAGGGRTAAGCATGRAAAGRAIARRRPARCHSG